jgi:hypothetical protein
MRGRLSCAIRHKGNCQFLFVCGNIVSLGCFVDCAHLTHGLIIARMASEAAITEAVLLGVRAKRRHWDKSGAILNRFDKLVQEFRTIEVQCAISMGCTTTAWFATSNLGLWNHQPRE